MNLRFKLFTAFLSLIIIPLVVIGTSAYFFISDMIEKKYSQQSEITLKAISQSANILFMEMDKVTDSTIASKAIQDVLLNGSAYAENDPIKMNKLQTEFRDMLVLHPSVSFAYMYTFRDSGITKIYSRGNSNEMDFEAFKHYSLYRTVIQRDGIPKWVGPYEHPELTGDESVFTQIRVVKDISTLANQGVLFVQIKSSGLESLFRTFRVDQDAHDIRFFIVNDEGLVYFDSSNQLQKDNIKNYLKKNVKLGKSFQSNRMMFDGKESVVSSSGLGRENWHIVSVTSWDSLSREVNLYIKWLAILISLSLLAALLFNLIFMNRITRSITHIVRLMRRVEEGDMWVRMDERGKDEINMLSRGFNQLIDRINELFERVKLEQQHKNKAEMRLLQAQIKPHFLFNTLESINVLAIQNEGRKVSQMVYRLASILRISIQDKEEISISQEIEHLRSYLEIQKFRFTELFDFEINIPDEVMRCTILKLTLQPLVENSIQHGFDGIQFQGIIEVTGSIDGNDVVIMVRDNGIGMSNKQLNKFQYMVTDDTGSFRVEDPVQDERRGLGVRSVADRIRIQYGYRYGLYICSEEQHGTVIQVRIPKYGPGDVNEAKSDARR
ncbi:two-component sensor histidine kinase [Paenibacillus selenitireducens]|uniref:Two-component sensor histidine kinase n=1 Tax=Paenibacillus selenitireducens TaxID=1324314 RepID=A0A1T2XN68_9BACL|nr:histidine kinase [Paenibacillus selenitireducens]OPA81307.1 two-component sensor histidine kinase [Paenibacillus selenitireducens]